MLAKSKEEIVEALSKSIWDFKIGDNIIYNLKIIFALYEKSERVPERASLFYKPLVVLIVSIIEALMFDLVCRLDGATSHFPHNLIEKRTEIKQWIEKKKVPITKGSSARIIRYKIGQIVLLFKEHEVLGPSETAIYDELIKAAAMRNRIHIQNDRKSFERDENLVFTKTRLEAIERIFQHILDIMRTLYVRPFDSGQKEVWIEQLSGEGK